MSEPPRKTIVIIRGIPGVGKTWMCQAINDMAAGGLSVACVDTDDFIFAEYKKSPGPLEDIRERSADAMETFIEECPARVVVVCGVMFQTIYHHRMGAVKIFISIPPDQFYNIYLRTVERQAAAWKTRPPSDDLRGEEIIWYVAAAGLEAINLSSSFEKYVHLYSQAKDQDLSRGYRLKTQSQALAYIEALAQE